MKYFEKTAKKDLYTIKERNRDLKIGVTTTAAGAAVGGAIPAVQSFLAKKRMNEPLTTTYDLEPGKILKDYEKVKGKGYFIRKGLKRGALAGAAVGLGAALIKDIKRRNES